MREIELAKKAQSFFTLVDSIKCSVPEVPFLSRCIDLVLITKTNEVISIEFKVNDWRHAIHQASDHKLGADKAYICLPDRSISPGLITAVKQAGVGLMILKERDRNPFVEEILSPSTEKQNVDAFKTILLDTIQILSDNLVNTQCIAYSNC